MDKGFIKAFKHLFFTYIYLCLIHYKTLFWYNFCFARYLQIFILFHFFAFKIPLYFNAFPRFYCQFHAFLPSYLFCIYHARLQPDVQHRTYILGTAILFSVVKAEPTVAVLLGIFVWAAKSTAAFLCAIGQIFHDRLNAVEGRSIGKVHCVISFSWNEKARSPLQNFGQRNAKTADKFLVICLPFEAVIRL